MKLPIFATLDDQICIPNTYAKYISHYNVCNSTLPVRNVLSVSLPMTNKTSYMEQMYIEVSAVQWQRNKHMISVPDIIHRAG